MKKHYLLCLLVGLLFQAITGYTCGPGNLTATASPFVSSSDFNLPNTSPAVNAGDPTSMTVANAPYPATNLPRTDAAANPRIVGNRVDMGALEVQNLTPPCGTVVYVTQAGAGLQNGSSWENAFAGTSLQTAINTAATCGAQVWVAQGLYKPTTGSDPTISFVLKEGVAIYGGFVGNETALRPSPNPVTGQPSSSTLSGDIGTPGDSGRDSDNSGHVVRSEPGLTASAVLDGFVITKGNGQNAVLIEPNAINSVVGGGLYTISGSPSIRNCFFIDNYGSANGGAIYNENSSPIITNCRFEGNSAGGVYGSAISNRGTGTITITGSLFEKHTDNGNGVVFISDNVKLVVSNSTFRLNLGRIGGAFQNEGNTQMELTDCFLENNTARNGGAIYHQSSGLLKLTRCQFVNNQALVRDGGAIYLQGAGLEATDCRFTGNSSVAEGGGVSFSGGDQALKLTNCVFEGNRGEGDGGGAVFVNSGSATIINAHFASNTANRGGAVFLYSENHQMTNNSFVNNVATEQGGAIYDTSTSPQLTNTSFQGNQAEQGGAIYSEGGNVKLVNSVLWNNGGANSIVYPSGERPVAASYSLFDASVTGYDDEGNNLTTTLTPFVSTTSTQLRDCSVAINTGSNQAYSAANGPATDLAGAARQYTGGVIDRGAYEYQGNPTTLTVVNPAISTATVGQAFSQPFTAQGGSGPYSYSLVSSNLPASLSLSSAGVLSGTPTEAGSYSITVQTSDANGCSGTGTAYELTVRPASSFTVVQAPASQTACVGGRVTFSVRVTPDQGVTYAWYKNSADPRQPIQATTPDYTVEITDGGKAGRYIVRVTGADGSVVEQRETYLTVNQRPVPPPPTSTRRQLCPDATPVNLGQYVSRTNNSYMVRYYNAAGQLLPSSNVVLNQPGTYPFAVTQFDPATGCESVPTNFTLTVNLTTQLVTPPINQTVCSGSNVTLTVQATGTNLKYEWFRGSVANQNKLAENASRQTGTTTASLTLVKVSQSEPYYVRVTGDCGVVVSGAIAVTVQSCGARQGVSEAVEPGLQVRVLGNPTAGEWVDVELAGVGSESVRLMVSDERGHVLSEQGLAAGQGDGRHRVRVGQAAGHYLLLVSTATRRQTIRLLKH